MKLSNFELIEVIGSGPATWKFRAEIDVTEGFIFKKTTRRQIFRSYAESWCFVDTGEFTPSFQAERLERSYKAKTGKDLGHTFR